MDWQEALETVIADGGPEIYREYCDASHPRHEAWRTKMIAKVEAPIAPPHVPMPVAVAGPAGTVRTIPLELTMQLNKEVAACVHRTKTENAGCGCATCALGKGRNGTVNHWDCYRCLRPDDSRFT